MHHIKRAIALLAATPAVAGISVLGVGFLFFVENYMDSMPFAVCVIAAIGTLIFLVTRRIAFSVYAAWTVVTVLAVVSLIKHLLTGSGLHFYDIVFVAEDSSVSAFLLSYYPHYTFPLLAGSGFAAVVLTTMFIVEKPRSLSVLSRVLLVATAVVGTAATFPSEARSHLYYMRGSHASNFVVSLGDLMSFWLPNPLIARLNEMPAQEGYDEELRCGMHRPDVIFVHGESFLPPSFVPAWRVEDRAVGTFASDDGRTRAMGVETYGGGSWLTAMSVLSGISGADFEWMRPYLVKALTGRIRQSVPALLKDCGYRTAAVMATDRNFADLGPFLGSIGIDHILDANDTGAMSLKVRDSHHLQAALALINANRAAADSPMFLFVETLFPHSPYDRRKEPDVVVAGEPFVSDGEVNEFLRRLAISRQDMEEFYAALAENPGPHGTIVVEYGDHQPFVTDFDDDALDWSASKYATFFAVRSFGPAEFPQVPDHARLDAAFLGYWLLDAARLIEGGLVADMGRLVERCDGLFHQCAKRQAVDGMLRRRLDAGLLDLSGWQFGSN